MLLLTSNGLSSQALLNCVQSNMNNGKSAVIITTASAPFKKNDKHIPRLTAELESIGYSVDFFDFDEDDPKELLHMRECREIIQPLIQNGKNNDEIDSNIKNILLGDDKVHF